MGSRSAWDGPDEQRPLSKAGRRQAAALAKLLGDEPIGRIVSSPYVRCRETVAPLAERIGLPEQAIQRYEATDYAGVSFARLVDIAHALELTVHSDVRLAETG